MGRGAATLDDGDGTTSRPRALFGTTGLVAIVVACLLLAGFLQVLRTQTQAHNAKSGSLTEMYNYRFQKMKLVAEEKEAALKDTLDVLDQHADRSKRQEMTLEQLKERLRQMETELAEHRSNAHELDIAKRLKEQTEKAMETAKASVQVCRQEAAAALSEKNDKLMQADTALDLARKELEELQKELRVREGWVSERENRLSRMSVELSKSMQVVEERGRAIEWLAEKKRQDDEKHKEQVEFAKEERSCHEEVLELRKKLGALNEKKLTLDEKKFWAKENRKNLNNKG